MALAVAASLSVGVPLEPTVTLLDPRDQTAINVDIGPSVVLDAGTEAALRSFTETQVNALFEHPCMPADQRLSHAVVTIKQQDGISSQVLSGGLTYTIKYGTSVGPLIVDILAQNPGAAT